MQPKDTLIINARNRYIKIQLPVNRVSTSQRFGFDNSARGFFLLILYVNGSLWSDVVTKGPVHLMSQGLTHRGGVHRIALEDVRFLPH